MVKQVVSIGYKTCTLYDCENPKYIMIQPVDEHDLAVLDNEVLILRENIPASFLLVAVHIENWHDELSPWSAPAVFGNNQFGTGARGTLEYIENTLIPYVTKTYQLDFTTPIILGGYSLAGLFALWCAYQSNQFAAIAAVSPSVWFSAWIEFARNDAPLVDTIYLSLGDKEERTKNKVMATVGDCIREQFQLLENKGCKSILEWNKGNHFQDSDGRCAKGFIWCVNSISI